MRPARGLLTVRPVETPEMLPGGRIVLTETTREALTAGQMEVIDIGAPSICEDPDCERPHLGIVGDRMIQAHLTTVRPSDWVLIRHRALLPTHQAGLYCCAQDDILAVLQAG